MTVARGPDCDIVLLVFNALTYVKECVDAVRHGTAEGAYRLSIVDDASDSVTAAFLLEQATHVPGVVVQRNPENLGDVRSCNTGSALGSAPYVVLLHTGRPQVDDSEAVVAVQSRYATRALVSGLLAPRPGRPAGGLPDRSHHRSVAAPADLGGRGDAARDPELPADPPEVEGLD